MMAAEGHFGNSMARRQVLYLQIDAAVLVKFNDQIVTILNRLKFNGTIRQSAMFRPFKFFFQESILC